ncbi:MAG: hypothetical protein IJ730_00015 [Alphaproteobacteria bacterium]|nr:hypothetical protein [Alphaproteobacteria bacterium]
MNNHIAIIGMDGIFPGSNTIDELWQNLLEGKEMISSFSAEELEAAGVQKEALQNPNFIRKKGTISGALNFDNELFGYSPKEAQYMDPQQRKLMECAWRALENSGYDPFRCGELIGCFVSASFSSYLINRILPTIVRKDGRLKNEDLIILGGDKDFLASKISYKLNLRGISSTIQTACSSSLVAVHVACNSLINQECYMALAGGVSITFPEKNGYFFSSEDINSSSGHCSPFSANADGTIHGDGVGVVVLKRLQDAIDDRDYIHAVIIGSAVNNDGSHKMGYTAPSVYGQKECIRRAIDSAGVQQSDISYVETHGTGTKLGDPIEFAALKLTLGTKTKCKIGALKANIGHLDVASGIAGLIKTVYMLKHKKIPPLINFEGPNHELRIEDTLFSINEKVENWQSEGKNRVAGVSSFGIGGTNAHVVVKEAPTQIQQTEIELPYYIYPISANSESSLARVKNKFENFFEDRIPIAELNSYNMAYTLQFGRVQLKNRECFISKEFNFLKNSDHSFKGNVLSGAKKSILLIGEYIDIKELDTISCLNGVCTEVFDQILDVLSEYIDKDTFSWLRGSAFSENANFSFLRQISVQYLFLKICEKFGVQYNQILIKDKKWILLALILIGEVSFKEAADMIVISYESLDQKLCDFLLKRENNDNRILFCDDKSELRFDSRAVVYSFGKQLQDSDRVLLLDFDMGIYFSLLKVLSFSWCSGKNINWRLLYKTNPHRISLPTYEFEEKTFDLIKEKQISCEQCISIEDALREQSVEGIILAKIRTLLDKEDFALDDNYFLAGGDSLLALDLIDDLKTALNIEISLSEIFSYQTVRELGKLIQKRMENGGQYHDK